MEKNQSTCARYLRYAHELLFSLNIALVARWAEVRHPVWGFYYWDVLEYRIEFAIEKIIYTFSHPNSRFVPKDVEGHTAFLLLALGLALCIFLLLRLFAHTVLANESLRSVAGFVSLLALPTFWLYITNLNPQPPGLPNPPRALLFLELAVTIATALFYLRGKWFLSKWSVAALIIFHHALWGWLFLGGVYFWHAPFEALFPGVALCASLAWSLYAKPTHNPRPTFTTGKSW
jgi:hypothetical protein